MNTYRRENMANKIRNSVELLSHGDIESRKIVLDITEKALESADSYYRIKSMIDYDGAILRIGSKEWDLSNKKNVYLIGAGKACNAMVMAIEDIIGDRLTSGIAIVKVHESTDHFTKTDIYVGGHPLPNAEGVRACKKIFDLVEQSGKDDLFIVLISGGSTALMACPVDGISLEDKILTTDIMLKSGARVSEINAVRRHISQMNGGRLGQRIKTKGAELIGITIYDEVGMPETKDITVPVLLEGTPIGPDSTTFADALRAIIDNGVEKRIPAGVMRYLKNAQPEDETPKSFEDFTYYIINTVPDSCRYAQEAAESMGYKTLVLTTYLEGESKSVGTMLASIGREIQINGRPISPPCVILCVGEATTLILDNNKIKGHGGPSHELVTSFALAAEKIPGACMLSIDTEGTDGSTMAAGGITDSTSYTTSVSMGVDLIKALREHSTGEALSKINDQVVTGNTGTNLCDLNIMYVPSLDKCK
jgi:glycerate 2-kinase